MYNPGFVGVEVKLRLEMADGWITQKHVSFIKVVHQQ